MTALGVPDFGPVQNNVSFNDDVGVTRGIHAEPWDKYVSLAHGRIFGAWVDLRAGESFGRLVTIEMGPETAVFVPRGVGNSYQTLEPGTAYSYLVNKHWSEAARASYTMVNLADPTLEVPWPIPLEESERSEADKNHPLLSEVQPFRPTPVLVLGSGGQLGTALREAFPDATAVDLDVVDFTDPASFDNVSWADYDVVINAAAYTAVDAAETARGPRARLADQRHGCPGSPRWPTSTASLSCTSAPSTSSTAPARSTSRTRASRRPASTPRPRPPATRSSRR